MAKDIFRAREQAEEAVYFHQQDEKLITKIREAAHLAEIAKALAEKLHIDNPQLLRRIVDLGITLDTGAAFLLSPFIKVAWVDGKITDRERTMIVQLAQERGIEPGSPDFVQLQQWLNRRPPDALFDAAMEAMRIGLAVLSPEERKESVIRILNAGKKMADSTDGLSKILHVRGSISAAQRAVLEEIGLKISGTSNRSTSGNE